ncbi:MAG: pyridoxamine 5'-phosphate oxidase family protein [Actinomycetota bacterium]
MRNYLDLAQTPTILELQRERGSRGRYDDVSDGPDALSPEEVAHLTDSSSFFMATVNEEGWPYVQHRGGDRGFVKVLGPTSIGWAERSGNRQYLGTGNVVANGRVSLIFVDHARRTRLKLLGVATLHREPDDELRDALNPEGRRDDGVITVEILATAWNCPKHIPQLVDAEQVAAIVRPLQERIDELEATIAGLEAPPTAGLDCAEVIATTDEQLAALDGEPQAALVGHLAGCDRCRTHLAGRTCD